MKNLAFDTWDDGRLVINTDFAEFFRQHRLTTCEAIWQFSQQAEPAKVLRTDRVTLRFSLPEADGASRTFYIKRHGRSSWKEYVKPWLQGQKPLLGAQHEWEALIAFHQHGLPTMTAVACGRMGDRSFLITAALENCDKLSAVFPLTVCDESVRRRLIRQTADIARDMHAARLHHQDFYLGHLLQERRPSPHDETRMYLIDLGRVRPLGPFFARRWIVKDLAQLNFSAKSARRTDRLRFLQRYLNRRLTKADRGLIRSILGKTAKIARHSAKNGL